MSPLARISFPAITSLERATGAVTGAVYPRRAAIPAAWGYMIDGCPLGRNRDNQSSTSVQWTGSKIGTTDNGDLLQGWLLQDHIDQHQVRCEHRGTFSNTPRVSASPARGPGFHSQRGILGREQLGCSSRSIERSNTATGAAGATWLIGGFPLGGDGWQRQGQQPKTGPPKNWSGRTQEDNSGKGCSRLLFLIFGGSLGGGQGQRRGGKPERGAPKKLGKHSKRSNMATGAAGATWFCGFAGVDTVATAGAAIISPFINQGPPARTGAPRPNGANESGTGNARHAENDNLGVEKRVVF
ncbi:hypothetical protein HNY73_009211 [Argiope bruennichi]|uniref:Uncharacterized protein n=1 Tax=Argiope bruennichi TaxID=94029 RepID=A0A8T0FFD3_ARGBR|nr:hypothetical protein HNY73_009211 [Argiope bruennichi]